jgi:hypothetical protein
MTRAGWTTLRLRFTQMTQRRFDRLFTRTRRARATLAVRAVDAAGNPRAKKRAVAIRD